MDVKRLPTNWPNFTPRGNVNEEKGLKDVVLHLFSLLQDWRNNNKQTIDDMAEVLDVTEGSGAPGTTPTRIGLKYLDTTAKDMYIAVGTGSSADWKKITP